MSLGIHFDEDVSTRLFALGRSWGRAMERTRPDNDQALSLSRQR